MRGPESAEQRCRIVTILDDKGAAQKNAIPDEVELLLCDQHIQEMRDYFESKNAERSLKQ